VARKYGFPLPYQISGLQDSIGISDLQSAGLWNQIPADLQAKLQSGAGIFSSGVLCTQADLDELPDPVWAFIAEKLGLQWQAATTES
jgi:hypothetical protein